MIQALIFDLDNCLAPATEVGEELMQPVFAAIADANEARLDDTTLQQAFADMWRHPYDWVARHYQFTKEMFEAGWEQMKNLRVNKGMQGYGDLPLLKELPGERFLVTSGFYNLQQSKIRALNLSQYFRQAMIDAIDKPNRLGKQGLFEDIMQRHNFAKSEVIVIGDNKDSEILAGRNLGLVTVQTLRAGVPHTDDADYHVNSLQEFKYLLDEKFAQQ